MKNLAEAAVRLRGSGLAVVCEAPTVLRLDLESGFARASFAEHATGEWRVTTTTNTALTAENYAWLEAVAREALAAELEAGATAMLCRQFDATPPGPELREARAAGLEHTVAEDEMRRPTTGVPDGPLPAGLLAVPFSEDSAPLFHHAYEASFRDRPGFPGWDEARWRTAIADAEEFRSDLSRVVLEGAEPVAFTALWVEEGTGWIIQMGVRPGWRGRGLGEFLLVHALNAFAADGLGHAALEVATNNPNARALYERMGFRKAGGYQSWRKPIR